MCALGGIGGGGAAAAADALQLLRGGTFGLVTPIAQALSAWLAGDGDDGAAPASARQAVASQLVAALAVPPPPGDDGEQPPAAHTGGADVPALLDEVLQPTSPSACFSDADCGASIASSRRWRGARLAAASLLCALLSLSATRRCLYASDIQVLVDLLLRELADLAPEDCARLAWLRLLQAVLMQTQWGCADNGDDDGDGGGGGVARHYRAADCTATLTSMQQLAAAGRLPADVGVLAGRLLAELHTSLE